MSTDQYTFQDPTKMYAGIDPTAQQQDGPGLDADLDDTADRGESTYRGSGRLEGRKALITGADSGIGAAVAIAYAREGADVALSYLPRRRRTRGRSSPSSRRPDARPSRSPATSRPRSSAASSSRRPSRASAASTSS
ncbi:putative oxidoreductase YghA [Clavibacter michiganensis]|uniref:Putative oxidoreductase YghA n=1 Tax=Clavibacter michiganensis TaxID=28447 RepID=A0A251XWR1_9MICO|nr:putative oxidoreductase YghA [Clavibacter michiganensis]